MVSSETRHTLPGSVSTFQSRNRGSYGFKNFEQLENAPALNTFQSRNRGSYGFKYTNCHYWRTQESWFQSRNRGSYGFKLLLQRIQDEESNLFVFQSRNRGSYGFKLNYFMNGSFTFHNVSIS